MECGGLAAAFEVEEPPPTHPRNRHLEMQERICSARFLKRALAFWGAELLAQNLSRRYLALVREENLITAFAFCTTSMKIMRNRLCPRNPQRSHPLRLNRNHVVLILQRPFNEQKLLIHHHNMVFSENLRRNNRVSNPGLIFQAQKYKSLSRPRSLPRNHRTRHAHLGPISHVKQITRRQNPLPPQISAVITHWMRPHRHPRIPKIGNQPRLRCHGL